MSHAQQGNRHSHHHLPQLPELPATRQVLFETLPDYHPDDPQPSYVLAIPCRPIVVALATLLPNCPAWANVDWKALEGTKPP